MSKLSVKIFNIGVFLKLNSNQNVCLTYKRVLSSHSNTLGDETRICFIFLIDEFISVGIIHPNRN